MSAMKRIVGPKPTRRLSHHGAPVSSGFALTTTLWFCRRSDSAFVFANAGISVWNSLVFFEPAYCSAIVNVPCTAVPFVVMDATRLARTCCRKNGEYGTRTRGCAFVARDAAQ